MGYRVDSQEKIKTDISKGHCQKAQFTTEVVGSGQKLMAEVASFIYITALERERKKQLL